MNDKALEWKKLGTEHIVKNKWIDFRSSRYLFPDGREIGPFYTYTRADFVVIASSDEAGDHICVRQFRQGIEEVTTEFPAGGLEPGEDELEAAKRELLEETGYVSDEWRRLIRLPASATISDNYVTVFEARGCRKAAEQQLDDTEFVNVVKLSPAELERMVFAGEFQQAIHVMAWLLAKR